MQGGGLNEGPSFVASFVASIVILAEKLSGAVERVKPIAAADRRQSRPKPS